MIPTTTRRALLLAALSLAALPGCGELDSGPEAAMDEWQQVGPVSVVVRGVAARQLTGSTYLGPGYSKDPVCVITVGFRVEEAGKEIQYVAPSASLRDGDGRSYPSVTFGMGTTLNESAGNKTLRKGDTVSDILAFAKEAAKARPLHLRVSVQWKEKEGGTWKQKSGGTARFKLTR